MAVITFTQSDVLQTTTIKDGLYEAVVKSITGPKPSSSGKSNNYWVNVEITEGPVSGKDFDIMAGDGINDASLLGTLMMWPHTIFMDIDSAINAGKEKKPGDIDTDQLTGKPLCIKVTTQTVDGMLKNFVAAFYPAGYSKTQPGW